MKLNIPRFLKASLWSTPLNGRSRVGGGAGFVEGDAKLWLCLSGIPSHISGNFQGGTIHKVGCHQLRQWHGPLIFLFCHLSSCLEVMLALCSGLFSSSHEPQDLTTLQAWRQQLYCRQTGKFAIFKGNGGQDIPMSSSSFLGLKSETHFNLPFPPVVFLKLSCPLSLRLVAPMFGDDDEAVWQSKVLAS